MEQVNTQNEVLRSAGLNFASEEHSDTLTEISLAAKSHWGYDADFMEACREELTITPEQIADSRNIFLIKKSNDIIIGFVYIKPLSEVTASLEALFIRPENIGYGYGTEILNAAKLLAKSHGYEKLVIDSDPNAAGFYEKMGAVKIGEVPSESINNRALPQYELLI